MFIIILMLFYPFRSDETYLTLSGSYVVKLNEPEVSEIVNRNKLIFEPDADLEDLVLQNICNDLENNQNPYAQQENDEVTGLINDNPQEEEVDDVNTESAENFGTFTNVTHQLLSDKDINTWIRSLNEKQRATFDVVLRWGKQFVH